MNESRHLVPSKRRPSGNAYSGKGITLIYLYVVYCHGHAKIGISANPKTRIGAMRSGCPLPMHLSVSYPLARMDALEAEKKALIALEHYHKIGEWYECTENEALVVVSSIVSAYSQAPVPPTPPKKTWDRNRSRMVQTQDKIFNSVTETAIYYKISKQAVSLRIKKGYQNWCYLPFKVGSTNNTI
jgi:hypothetical protein